MTSKKWGPVRWGLATAKTAVAGDVPLRSLMIQNDPMEDDCRHLISQLIADESVLVEYAVFCSV